MSAPRRFHPALLGVLLAAFAAAIASPAHAAHGVIDLSWGTCAPVVANLESPAAGPLSLIVSVLGNDQTHNAYVVYFVIGSTDDTVPDAWRFDDAGCQAGFLEMNPIPPTFVAKTCPAFQGIGASMQIKDYDFVPPGFPFGVFSKTMMRGVLANTYPSGSTTLASQRYHLAHFRFDHTLSVAGPSTPGVSCGGYERPMIVTIGERGGQIQRVMCSYLRASDGLEFPFEAGNTVVTVNGSLPARASTWGQIKGAYRR